MGGISKAMPLNILSDSQPLFFVLVTYIIYKYKLLSLLRSSSLGEMNSLLLRSHLLPVVLYLGLGLHVAFPFYVGMSVGAIFLVLFDHPI